MRALKREQERMKSNKEYESMTDWDSWTKWLQERQEAIDNAKTPEQKAAVAAQYKRSYIGQI
jgi:hypothetical protein